VQAAPTAPAAPDTHARLLDAAERCLHRYGLRRVSMADIAAEAGMSRGSIYNWFADRQALVDAVLVRTAERFVASSEVAVDRRRTLTGQVAEAAVFIADHLHDEALTLRLPGEQDSLFATLLTAHSTTLVERWVEFWLPRLAAAEARGEIRRGLDHRRAAEWIVRLMLSFAVMPSATVDLSDADDVRAFVKDHLGGLA
jgi:AcrR family transcriptional regulator